MYKRFTTMAATALFLAVGTAAAQDDPSGAAKLEYQTSKSDLVFVGTVANITYRNSYEGIPHTFVTYWVDQVLKGDFTDKKITLRFLGGVRKEGQIVRTLVASNAPRFADGQQDLLMVAKNGESSCPVVQCAEGRYRFDLGMVKTELGSVIAKLSDGGAIALSETDSHLASIGKSVEIEPGAYAKAYTQAEFASVVKNIAVQQGKSAEWPKPVRSADPSNPFKGTLPTVAGPPSAR